VVHAANVRLHLISGTDELQRLDLSTKFNTELAFPDCTCAIWAVATAERWLEEHFEQHRQGVDARPGTRATMRSA
jgi:NTE family protein